MMRYGKQNVGADCRRETVPGLCAVVADGGNLFGFYTLGEAQHHSSRTIEELFGRMGYLASETADFDPTGYPSDRVVELWEIRPG